MENSIKNNFRMDEEFALELDQKDELAHFRSQFHLPNIDGKSVIYFCGNSLGLQPKSTSQWIGKELDKWADFAVQGHFKSEDPWVSYDVVPNALMAKLIGASSEEVALMNGLTINLHLMMVSFYRPTSSRYKILIEADAFPSDKYAVDSQARFHGFDPKSAIIELRPRKGEHVLRTADIVDVIEKQGEEIALVLLPGVNYLTGQVFDIESITQSAHESGCIVGIDLAHAAGNIVLELHKWDVDFAVWCTYKYLNAGPGSVAGCFVHERHKMNVELPRFTGWWGTDPSIRFEMRSEFSLRSGAAGWQLSNLPILSMAALRASLELFDQANLKVLRRKSELLTGYLLFLLKQNQSDLFTILTPLAPSEHGCQVSIYVYKFARQVFQELEKAGVICDFREPGVIRVAPVPLYNTFHEVWQFVQKHFSPILSTK